MVDAALRLPVQQNEASQIVARRAVYVPAGAGERSAGEYLAGAGLITVGAALIGGRLPESDVARQSPTRYYDGS
ncbi:hypothetical protein BAY59_38040 [Prauserella coralliicola]|uniref:Uncharacterized protein n=1 Tax=Prauserella flavalba TaxID=1477506 RepID=A0A318LXM1_9PSEU|nr:hypothetical protein BAY59_38040 [Prauserella coralliicola]PXY17491.1 hypothetical protein BA062_37555 [Prauserella flavalba]